MVTQYPIELNMDEITDIISLCEVTGKLITVIAIKARAIKENKEELESRRIKK